MSGATFISADIARDYLVFYPERDPVEIAANDLPLVIGPPNDLITILCDNVFELSQVAKDVKFAAEEKESLIVEMIIPHQSSLLGEKLLETHVQEDPDI